MTSSELTAFIKDEARLLGFETCGIAPVSAISKEHERFFHDWLEKSQQGDMHYMENHLDKRLNPRLLVPGGVSIIVVALGYYHPVSHPEIARYALNPDYHPLIRQKLYTLLSHIREQDIPVSGKAFTDSAPVAERYWALQAGLGWIGKNNQLIIPGKGSWFLLGELVINLALEYDHPVKSHCGNCHRCIDACPGNALNEKTGLNARQCLSYLTIEKKGSFSLEEAHLCGSNGCFFGCDRCQEVCPWNRFSQEQSLPDFQPFPELTNMDPATFSLLTETGFQSLFKKTSLYRTGLSALQRNHEAIKKFRSSER